jgi:lipoprotein-anchoring transpeptidase ErfK/SrfK
MVTGVVVACCLGVTAIAVGATRSGRAKVTRTDVARSVRRGPSRAAATRALTSAIRISPPDGASNVAPDAPVEVDTAIGRLGAVRVLSAGGDPVAGMLVASGTQWRSIATLTYGTTYHVFVTATGAAHARAVLTSTFGTVIPATFVSASMFPSEGLIVGVGQPIVFHFDQSISSPAAQSEVLSHLDVTESQPVLGGWRWFSDDELHFRPDGFWPAHEQVTVSWDLDGWDAGSGMWGGGQGSTHFVVGDAHVSFVNLVSDLMTVTDNGRVVATYPVSGGKPTDPTMDGTHIVLDKASVVRMDSATNGIPVNSPDGYDELVYNDVHISDSGEYVHAAPWSVASQGHTNVSHGCVNISPTNALAFFKFSQVGDVVIIGGSPRPPVVGDHGVMDWSTASTQFTPANTILPAPTSISILR